MAAATLVLEPPIANGTTSHPPFHLLASQLVHIALLGTYICMDNHHFIATHATAHEHA